MRSLLIAAAVPLLLMSGPAQEAPRISEEARRLHRNALVFDGHVHMINRQLHLGDNIGDRLDDVGSLHIGLSRVGCGMQIPVIDIDGDGDRDIICPGKSSLFLIENLTADRR